VSFTSDTTAPNLSSLILPSTIDLSSGKAELTITGIATDDISGVKNVIVSFDRNLAYSYSPSDTYAENTNILVNAGIYDSWSDGESSQTWLVAATNPSGQYNIVNVEVKDLQGNSRTYSAEELGRLGVNTSINFTNSKADITPPHLKKLTVPQQIDLSSGKGALTISALAADDMAGIKSIVFAFDKKFAYSYSPTERYAESTDVLVNGGVYDTWSDGSSSQTWHVATTNTNGAYNINSVRIEDLQGNVRSYLPAELEMLGVNTSISFINSKPDTTPPKLESLNIPAAIELSSGKTALTIDGLITDDLAGVKNIVISFNKSFAYSYSAIDNYAESTKILVNGGIYDSWEDQTSSQTWFVAGTNQPGLYHVTEISIEDLQGNTRSYAASELASLGINTTVLMAATKHTFSMNENVYTGSTKSDWAIGGDGDDIIKGLGGDDMLEGGPGDDVLDGGSGADIMIGGSGNDIYYVDWGNDKVIETSSNGGIDTVISSVSRTLGDNQENLILTGSLALNGTGNGLANTLIGNSGENVLNGGAGADTMMGGLGNDTYYVDWGNDKVIENSPDGGIDTIISSVSRTLGEYQENLTLTGISALYAIGNNLANILVGNSADNILNGGAGADTMTGGLGNDTYYVDWGNDKVIETSPNGGIDTIISSVSRTLGEYQENLTLTGSKANYGTGNALDNTLVGNSSNNTLSGGAGNDALMGGAGNDRLIGGLGKDILTGGSGDDIFVFGNARESEATSSTCDVITDFKQSADKIDISKIDANTTTSTRDAFTAFVNDASGFTAAGQLKFANGVLYGNTDLDTEPEFAVQIAGITSLSLSDLML